MKVPHFNQFTVWKKKMVALFFLFIQVKLGNIPTEIVYFGAFWDENLNLDFTPIYKTFVYRIFQELCK